MDDQSVGPLGRGKVATNDSRVLQQGELMKPELALHPSTKGGRPEKCVDHNHLACRLGIIGTTIPFRKRFKETIGFRFREIFREDLKVC
jgi:hypothetical protein